MDYAMISADDHLDLQYLPADLWTARLPASLRARGPHVEHRDAGSVWVCDGGIWGRWAGAPRPKGPKPTFNAFDRGGVDESEMRPARAELRLADMDRDGVEAQVMYGPVSSMTVADPALRRACLEGYNDWLFEFCAAAPRRLLGVAILPPEDPAAACQEVYRLARKGGLRQANLQVAQATPRLHDEAWEPLWTAFEETGLILSFHVVVFGVGGSLIGVPAHVQDKTASVFNTTKLFMGQFLDPFVDLFAWGILERHPKLRLVMARCGLAALDCAGAGLSLLAPVGGQRVLGPAGRHRPHRQAQRAVPPASVGVLPGRLRGHVATSLLRRGAPHVGLGLSTPRQHVAELSDDHRQADGRSPARGAPAAHARQCRGALRSVAGPETRSTTEGETHAHRHRDQRRP
jgi:predicted TIM-barrel fold metal-dependent hydrolase